MVEAYRFFWGTPLGFRCGLTVRKVTLLEQSLALFEECAPNLSGTRLWEVVHGLNLSRVFVLSETVFDVTSEPRFEIVVWFVSIREDHERLRHLPAFRIGDAYLSGVGNGGVFRQSFLDFDRADSITSGDGNRIFARFELEIAGFCSSVLYIFLNSWIPTYAAIRLPITLGQAGAVAALLPAVGIDTRPVGGWVSDRIGYRRRPVVITSLAFALPAFIALSRAHSIIFLQA